MEELINKYSKLMKHYHDLYKNYHDNGFVGESLRYQDMYHLCAKITRDLEKISG